MFQYVYVVLFANGDEKEFTVRATSSGSGRNSVWSQLSEEERNIVEDIDLVEVMN